MKIELLNIGKKFNKDWIFRKIDHTFTPANHCAILGANGSGKSTLLQLIGGRIQSSEGKTNYFVNEKLIPDEKIYSLISLAAPYQELIEEFTLLEMLRFHKKFKKSIGNLEVKDIVEILGQGKFRNRVLKYFSSGMKQRVKLAIAILSDTPLLLLDEPLSNLDRSGYNWYRKLIEEYSHDRIIIVCSNNQEQEYFFCDQFLQLEDYKIGF